MCGLYFSTSYAPLDLDLRESLIERGPDNYSEIKHDGNIFVQSLLSISGTSNLYQQPVVTDEHVILFNGEILNLPDLVKRNNLDPRISDEISVIISLLKYKEIHEILHMLDGFYAILIYDKKTKQLYALRDHFGVKPLHYDISASLRIMSDSSFLADQNKIDVDTARQFIKSGISVGSCISRVTEFTPGLIYQFDLSSKIPKLKNKLEANPFPYSNNVDTIDQYIEYCVRMNENNFGNNTPIVYKSDGIDSRLIYKLMRNYRRKVKFLNLTFQYTDVQSPKKIEESPCGQNVIVDADDFLDNFDFIVRNMAAPSDECFNTYFASHYSSKFSRIAVMGSGIDEAFLGYDYLRFHEKSQKEDYLTANMKSLVNRIKRNRYTASGSFYRYDRTNIVEKYRNISLPMDTHSWLYALDPRQAHEINGYLRYVILKDSDKMGHLNNVEIRPFFLNKGLISFLLRNKEMTFVNEHTTKIPFRSIAQKYDIVQTSNMKSGFEFSDYTLFKKNRLINNFNSKEVREFVYDELGLGQLSDFEFFRALKLKIWCNAA